MLSQKDNDAKKKKRKEKKIAKKCHPVKKKQYPQGYNEAFIIRRKVNPRNILGPVIYEESYKGSKVNCTLACSERQIALDRGSIKL